MNIWWFSLFLFQNNSMIVKMPYSSDVLNQWSQNSWVLRSLVWVSQSKHAHAHTHTHSRWLHDGPCLWGKWGTSNCFKVSDWFLWVLCWKNSLPDISVNFFLYFKYFKCHFWDKYIPTISPKQLFPLPCYSLMFSIFRLVHRHMHIFMHGLHACLCLVYSCLSLMLETKLMEGWVQDHLLSFNYILNIYAMDGQRKSS